jgi:lycopene cyclase CruA
VSQTIDRQSSIARSLAEHYPNTAAAFAAMGALDHLDRIARLDVAWDAIRRGQPAAVDDSIYIQHILTFQSQLDFDLIYAGGGLGLLHAVVMAHYGYRVMLFDRGEVGCAHREWNISRGELDALVEVGFCSWDELRDVIMAEYDAGVVRFYSPDRAGAAELWMPDVLNVALDANALLRLARRKLEAAGGVVLDRRVFRRVEASVSGPLAVRVELAREDAVAEHYTARLLLDGMGSSSPLALRRFSGQPFAGVCPTVGTVAVGFAAGAADDEHNPRIGDILISIADAQRGQQYMWEGFPGRGDELTVYLFYYDTLVGSPSKKLSQKGGLEERSSSNTLSFWPVSATFVAETGQKTGERGASPLTLPGLDSSIAHRPSSPSLMQLFEDYFELLPTYKRPGPDFRHIKPVYGYIPARHSVRRQEAPLLRGVLPIGDSAAQQSPLTFCGFGSHVRNLGRTTALLHEALRRGLTEPRHLHPISAYQVNVSLNWVFSRFMQPWVAPDDVNRLQNLFLRVLNDLGEAPSRRFFLDRMRWSDYHRMILGMFRRYPRIAIVAWRVLGPAGVQRWIRDYVIYCWVALSAQASRLLSRRGRAGLAALLDRLDPALGLRLRARFAEWRVMGWIL